MLPRLCREWGGGRVQNELYHYGVKRRSGRYPWGSGDRPFQSGRHGTLLGQSRDEDIRIKKGTTGYRVQSSGKLEGEGQTYVSFDKLDHFEYLSVAASGEGGVAIDARLPDGTGKYHSVQLKLTEDLIAPSYQKIMETFVDTIGDVGGPKEMARKLSLGNDFIEDCKNMKMEECRDRAYEKFVMTFMRDTEPRKAFIDSLKEQGYNAVIDENDKHFGKDSYTEAPVIVFDKNKSLKVDKAFELSEKDVELLNESYWDNIGSNLRTGDEFDKKIAISEFDRISKWMNYEEGSKKWRKLIE